MRTRIVIHGISNFGQGLEALYCHKEEFGRLTFVISSVEGFVAKICSTYTEHTPG